MVVSEPELIVPALSILKDHVDGLTTTELSMYLRGKLRPSGHDLDKLSHRPDDVFSQKVRNLTGSHRTLYGKGLASYDEATGISKITTKGLLYVYKTEPLLEALKRQGFSSKQIEKEAVEDYENIIVEEGAEGVVSVKHRERSQKLRKAKVRELIAKYGKLSCKACEFDFSKAYGSHGKNYIEIHHLKPVHQMEVIGTKTKLGAALKKVVPLCSNCHRVIHRKPAQVLSITQLKTLIKVNFVWT